MSDINTKGSFLLWEKDCYKYKKGLGNTHPAFCSTLLFQYSRLPAILNIDLNLN
jgi:hypothetical protein